MTTASVITGGLNGIVLALTPVERWEAASRFNSNFMAQHWFILTTAVAIITLTALLAVISFYRIRQERKATEKLFVEYAEKRGLTAREYQILLGIANKAGLKRNESIFTLASAFDRGAAKMEESKQLKTEMSFLREKLGFVQQTALSVGSSTKLKKLSSRQIPAGKKLYIKQQKDSNSEDIESTVIANKDTELTVELTNPTNPVKITFGESWRARYYFSSSVWEFDTSVVSYDGDILVLNHSDNVRFINRRRFLRVPVKRPAFIARLPFSRTLDANATGSMKSFRMYRSSAVALNMSWGPPEFVPAVVTELAGPGLRIESKLEVEAGERVLVIFSLDEEQGRDLTTANAGILKIVEDIGEVRHTRAISNGLSIAVELTGLSDSDVDELTRATNAAAMSVSDRNKDVPTSEDAVERVPEHAGPLGA